MAQPAVGVRALDEPGNVGDGERVARARRRDAEVRVQRGERVRGDLGLGARDRAEQRRLARVRKADEADVGDELQREPQRYRLAGEAVLGDVDALQLPRANFMFCRRPRATVVALVHQLGEQRRRRVGRRHSRLPRRWARHFTAVPPASPRAAPQRPVFPTASAAVLRPSARRQVPVGGCSSPAPPRRRRGTAPAGRQPEGHLVVAVEGDRAAATVAARREHANGRRIAPWRTTSSTATISSTRSSSSAV